MVLNVERFSGKHYFLGKFLYYPSNENVSIKGIRKTLPGRFLYGTLGMELENDDRVFCSSLWK